MGRGRQPRAVYAVRNGKSVVATEQEIGGNGHAVGEMRKGYDASIREYGNIVKVSELCAGQSSQCLRNLRTLRSLPRLIFRVRSTTLRLQGLT